MVKGVLVLLLAFNMLAAEGPVSPQIQGYTVENQYEGKDGTIYYESQKLEVLEMGQTPEAQNEPQRNIQSDPRPYAERKDYVNNEQSADTSKAFQDQRPYAERKDFVNNEPSADTAHPLMDQRPYAERKDFVSLQEDPTIEWIVGKTSTDITFAVVNNKVVAYKTTTYLLALKPKAPEAPTNASNSYSV